MKVHLERNTWDEHWKMDINLDAVCKTEGKKVPQVDNHGYGTGRMVADYPIPKVKKLFKLIVDNISDEEQLDDISSYLKKNSKGFCKLFEEIRKKRK